MGKSINKIFLKLIKLRGSISKLEDNGLFKTEVNGIFHSC